MKQNKHYFIHGLLIILVLLSLIITYFIIASPVEIINWVDSVTHNEEEASGLNSTSEDGETQDSREHLNDLVIANRLIIHDKDDNYWASNDSRSLGKLQEDLAALPYDRSQAVTTTALDTFRENKSDSDYLEFTFLDFLTSALFSKMHPDIFNEEDAVSFNQVVFVEGEDSLYLISESDHLVYQVPLDRSINEVIAYEDYTADKDKITEVTPVVFSEGRKYISKEKETVNKLTYMLERQPNTFFLGALFSSPEEIHDYSDDSYSRYYANGHQLAISNHSYELNFSQDTSSAINVTEWQKIGESFNMLSRFIPEQDTWVLSDYQEDESTITYRKFVDNIPVYGPDHVSRAVFKMDGNQVAYLSMSALTIQTQLDDLAKPLELMSGTNALELLRNNGYDPSQIQNMQIGYRWVKSPESDRLVELVPTWHVKRDGVWYALEDIVDMSDYNHLRLYDKEEDEVFDWEAYFQDSQDQPVESESDTEEALESLGNGDQVETDQEEEA